MAEDLEQQHPDQPVVPQERSNDDCEAVGPVPKDGEVRHGEVVDVQGLVETLVPVEAEVGGLLQDRLVGGVDDQTDQDRREREPRDEQRDDEPHRQDRDDDQRVGISGEHEERVDRVTSA